MHYDDQFEQGLRQRFEERIIVATDSMAVRNLAAEIITACDNNQRSEVTYIPSSLSHALFIRMGEVMGIQLKEQEWGNPTDYALTSMHIIEGMFAILYANSTVTRGTQEAPAWHKRLTRIHQAANWESMKG